MTSELPIRDDISSDIKPLNRADEVDDLLKAVQSLIIPFIKSADEDSTTKHTGHGKAIPGGGPRTALLEYHKPEKLKQLLDVNLPTSGAGKDGLLKTIEQVLQYSVNTWDQGFLDKLYSSTNAVGLVSELILATLNTNVHVYQVSPVLTIIEKATATALAHLFGLTGPHAGGISTQGGSASNSTALLIARNTLYPSTKTSGNASHNFVLFTSAHGHYSLTKAAQTLGLGTDSVIPIPVDSLGRMIPSSLESAIKSAKEKHQTPLFVNATAGTTVHGSYDPFPAISKICKDHNLWMHIDASWGGPVIFSQKWGYKMQGSDLADSIAINPHKMLNVPVTCSFLVTGDLRRFHRATRLKADYLFHGDGDDEENDGKGGEESEEIDGNADADDREVYDLADLTMQCGRRGDSLKLALAWIYYGSEGFEKMVDHAFEMAGYLMDLVEADERLERVGCKGDKPECLQVCFWYIGEKAEEGGKKGWEKKQTNKLTKTIVANLIPRGFMIDYAGDEERGSFFRVVVNVQTRRETLDGLVRAIGEVGGDVEERIGG